MKKFLLSLFPAQISGRTYLGKIKNFHLALSAIVFFALFSISAIAQDAPKLGEAERFAVLSRDSVMSQDSIFVKGDVGGTEVDSAIKSDGGTFKNSCLVDSALQDYKKARQEAEAQPPTATSSSELKDTTLSSGVYQTSYLRLQDTITLSGDSTSVFIFNVDDSVVFESGTVIILDGVKAENVFWSTSGTVCIEDSALICGTVMADGTICCHSGAEIKSGRLLSGENITMEETKTIDSRKGETFTIADIDLGEAAYFGLLSGASIFANDIIYVNGNVGAAENISGIINADDTLLPINDCRIQQAISDAGRALFVLSNIDTLVPLPSGTGALNGLTLAPGFYTIPGNSSLNGTLTLTGDSNSVYFFSFGNLDVQYDFAVKTGAVLNLGNVKPENVYWFVNHIVLNAGINFSGVVMSTSGIVSYGVNTGKTALLTKGNITLYESPSFEHIHIWSQTKMHLGQPPTNRFDITLGSSAFFALLSGGNITAEDTTLAIGKVGATGTITGFISTSDTVFSSNHIRVQEALSDANTAKQKADSLPKKTLPQNLGGLVLGANAYYITGNAMLNGVMALKGDSTSKYVFFFTDSFIVKQGSFVKLHGVLPKNVLWFAGGKVLIEESASLPGVIIASQEIEIRANNQSKLALFSLNEDILIKNDHPDIPSIFNSASDEVFAECAGATLDLIVNDITVCGIDTFSIIVNVGETVPPIYYLRLFAKLPPGINYVIGTVNIDTLYVYEYYDTIQQGTVFVVHDFGDTIARDTLTLTFRVSTGCALENSDSLTALVYPVVNDAPFNCLIDTSASFQILSPNLSISQQNGINPLTSEVNIKDEFCRTITVTNTGNAPLTQGFTILEDYGPAIEIYSISIGAIDSSNNKVYINISPSDLPPGGLKSDSSFIIIECIRVVECTQNDTATDLGKSEFAYYWGCPGDTCQYDNVSANVVIPKSNKPSIGTSLSFADTAVCYGPDHSSLTKVTISNNGTGPAFDVKYRLYADSGFIGIDTSGFLLIRTQGDTIEIIPDESTFVASSTAPTPLCRDSFLSYVSFDSLGDIPKGKSISLLFHTITCCPPESGCGYTRTMRDSVSYIIPCIDSLVHWYNPHFFEQQASWGHTKANIPGMNPTDIYDWAPKISMWDTVYPCNGPPTTDSTYRGDIGWFAFKSVANLYRWNGDSTQQLMVQFADSGGLCFFDTILWEVGGFMLFPDNIIVDYFDSASCGGTVTAFFSLDTLKNLPASAFNGGFFYIKYLAQCPAPAKTIIEMTASFLPSVNCADTCAIPVSCYSISTFVHCPGCDRSGILRPDFTAKRFNYGLPDDNNNGVADSNSGLPDFSRTTNNLLMVGDTLQCTMTSWVIQDVNPDTSIMALGFRYGYYEMAIIDAPCVNAMTLIGANGKIISGSSIYNFFIPPGMVPYISSEKKYVFDFSINVLSQLGIDTSLYNKFDFGDTIIIEPLFKITGNIGGDEKPCPINNFTYVSFVPFPSCDYSGKCSLTYDSCGFTFNVDKDSLCTPVIAPPCDTTMKYYCEKSGGEFYLAGYQFIATNSLSAQVNDCVQEFNIGNDFRMGIPTSPTQFPSEYRNWGFMDSAMFVLLPDFVYDSAKIFQSRNAPDDTLDGFFVAQTVSIDTVSSLGDTLYFSFANFFTDDTAFAFQNDSNKIYFSDDNQFISLTVYAHPTCATPDAFNPPTDQAVYLPASVHFDTAFVPEATANFSPQFNHRAMYVRPDLSAQGMPLSVDAVSTSVCWDVLFENASVGNASHVWLAGQSPSGNITITNIVVDNDTLSEEPGTIGIFPVGNLNGTSKKTVTVCANYDCVSGDTSDFLIVYFGWDCPKYPDSLGAYACPPPDTIALELKYRKAVLKQTVLVASSMKVCDTLPVQILVSSTDVANWQNVIVTANLPSGLNYYPSDTAQILYPSNNSLTPINASPVIAGNTLTWNLDSVNSFFEQNGLPGSGFLMSSPPYLDSTKLKLKFNLYGDCNINKNNLLVIRTKGVNNCGDTSVVLVASKNISVSNYPKAAKKTLKINVPDFNSCDSTAQVTVKIVNTDSIPTDSMDIINFILPGCVSYLNGSSNGISEPTLSGNELTWGLFGQDSISAGDSISFSFNLYAFGCIANTNIIFTANTYTGDSAVCDTTFYCHFNVPAGDAVDFAKLLDPLNISVDFIQDSCSGPCNAVATATVTGGKSPYTYLWSNGDSTNTVDSLCPGTYSVVVTDKLGCADSATIVIPTPPAPLTLSATASDALCMDSCNGSMIAVQAGGASPYSYLWSGGLDSGAAQINICPGTYFVTVTDGNNCTAMDSALVNQPLNPLAVSVSGTNLICYGASTGSATANVIGGAAPYSYSWSDGQSDSAATGLTAGTYYLTASDTNGCVAFDTITINQPLPISFIDSVKDMICGLDSNDGAMIIYISGGTFPYTVQLSNGQIPTESGVSGDTLLVVAYENLIPDTHILTVTDTNGCIAYDTLIINSPPPLAMAISQTNLNCYGDSNGTATVSVSGGAPPYTYLWIDSQNNSVATDSVATGLGAGTYFVTGFDANGCEVKDSVVITSPPQLILSAAVTDVLCNFDGFSTDNGSINLTVSGGTAPYAYSWSNGATSQDIGGLAAGTYSVTVSDGNNCSATLSATVSAPPPFNFSFSTTDVTCYGYNDGTATITGMGGTLPYTYQWSNGDTTQTISALPPGSYQGIIYDGNGCSLNSFISINEPQPIAIGLFPTGDVNCNGDSTGAVEIDGSTLTGGTPPYTFLWSNGDTTFDIFNLSEGIYTLTITDANGCTGTASDTVNVLFADPVITISTKPEFCDVADNGVATANVISGQSPFTYLWSNGLTSSFIGGLNDDTVSVIVIDSNGCRDTASAILIPSAVPCCQSSYDSVLGQQGITTNITPSNISNAPDKTYLVLGDLQFQAGTYNIPNGTIFYMHGYSDSATVHQLNPYQPAHTAVNTSQVGPNIFLNGVTLNADSVTFTSDCDTLWGGIYGSNGGNLLTNNTFGANYISVSNSEISNSAFGILLNSYKDNFSIRKNNFINNIHSSVRLFNNYVNIPAAGDSISQNTFNSNPATMPYPVKQKNSFESYFAHVGINIMGINNPVMISGNNFNNVLFGVASFEGASMRVEKNTFSSYFITGVLSIGSNVTQVNPLKTGKTYIMRNLFDYPITYINNIQTLKIPSYLDILPTAKRQFGAIAVGADSIVGNRFEGKLNINSILDQFGIAQHNNILLGLDAMEIEGDTLHNLKNGISWLAAGTSPSRINNNFLNNCEKGIYIQGANFFEVRKNKIDSIPKASATDNFGMYLVGAQGFEIDSNQLSGFGLAPSPQAPASYGIVVENSGSGGGTMFKNTFKGTDYGTQTQGDNQMLKIRCNDFAANGTGHNITAWSNLQLDSIGDLRDQGNINCNFNSQEAAGNHWFDNCVSPTLETDIMNDPNDPTFNNFVYYRHFEDILSGQTTNPECSTPIWEGDPTLLIQCATSEQNNSCASPFMGLIQNPNDDLDGFITAIKNIINQYAVLIITKQQEYAQLVDGGNTQSLLNTIAIKAEGQTKTALMEKSPYLSDEVMLTYLQKPLTGKNATNPGHIQQVIMANSPVTDTVMQAVLDKNLPPGTMNNINSKQKGISPREQLEREIKWMQQEIQLLGNEITRALLMYGTEEETKQALDSSAFTEAKMTKAELLVASDSTQQAKNLLNQLEQDTAAMKGRAKEETLHFIKMTRSLIDMKENNKAIFEMDALNEQKLKDVADAKKVVSAKAEVSLELANKGQYEHPIMKIYQPAMKTAPKGNAEAEIYLEEAKTKNNFKLYPNPTTGDIVVEFNAENAAVCKFVIYNSLGKQIEEYSLTASGERYVFKGKILANGIYYYKIYCDNTFFEQGKIAVIK